MRREGLWLEGNGPQVQWGEGGAPSKGQLGPARPTTGSSRATPRREHRGGGGTNQDIPKRGVQLI